MKKEAQNQQDDFSENLGKMIVMQVVKPIFQKALNDIENAVNYSINSSSGKTTPWMPSPDMLTGVQLIYAERERQISVKGYNSEHDDAHSDGQLTMLAEKYIFGCNTKVGSTTGERIKELSKAGALIAAEIDRLQRTKK